MVSATYRSTDDVPQKDVLGQLARRDLAVLTAVAALRCELVGGREPDLLVDGRWFCDQPRVWVLVGAGLLDSDRPRTPGTRVVAVLTEAGSRVLAEHRNRSASAMCTSRNAALEEK